MEPGITEDGRAKQKTSQEIKKAWSCNGQMIVYSNGKLVQNLVCWFLFAYSFPTVYIFGL